MGTNQLSTELNQEISRYLATGDSDALSRGVSGNLVEAMRSHDQHLRNALLSELQRRETGSPEAVLPPDFDLVTFTRRKVAPMISGLFPGTERSTVLAVAERSVVFLTREAVHRLIGELDYRESAWTIANIYLGSLGIASLDGSKNAPLGCNEHVTCYVSLEYFRQKDPFADYIVHEVAHMFHNCKRQTIGLPFTGRREWLLDIAFAMRETFAFACEVYSRIMEQAQKPAERALLLSHYAERLGQENQILNQEELLDILQEAVSARNGWKQILARCSNNRKQSNGSVSVQLGEAAKIG